MLKKLGFLTVVVILCLIVATPVTAQEPSHVRFAHYVLTGPAVNIFADEIVFKGEDGKPYGLNATELSRLYDTPIVEVAGPGGRAFIPA